MSFLAQMLEDKDVYVPPREFVKITPQVYISNLPHPRSIPFIEKRCQIESVLFLTPKDPLKLDIAPELRRWIMSREATWLPVEKAKGWQGKIVATQGTIKAGLEFVLSAKQPVLICGYDNIDSAALMVACLRKLQCWEMTSIQDEMGRYVYRPFPTYDSAAQVEQSKDRSIQLSLDALHLQFVHRFCSLAPPTSNECYQIQTLRREASTPTEVFSSTFMLPSPDDLPDWLWYGYRSPSALLYGHEYARTDLRTREANWHPTMRIAYRFPSHRIRQEVLDDDLDCDPLPTPRCRSSATSPERSNPFNNVPQEISSSAGDDNGSFILSPV